jgi:putative toxin-antitoxin system antitoxin component, TIGR02293 family
MTAATVAAALGGRSVLRTDIHSDFDLADAAAKGVPAEAAHRLVESGLLDAEELYQLVIPRRTLDRRRVDKEALTVTESDRLLRVVRVIVRAIEALGDVAKARTWLRTSNRSLRGRTPLSLLETDIGARMAERTLGRIEHGVYS